MTQWDFQNKWKSGWTGKSSFVLEVPLRHLRPSVVYSVPCDRILQRAYCPINTILDKKGGILTPRKSVVSNHKQHTWWPWLNRVKNPNTKSYTWSQNPPMILCRLDYWLISNNLHDLTTSTDIIPAIKTDHSAICLELCNNQINARALIGQSAVGYCAGKPTEKSRVFWINI